ncbi:MAG: hypothetical protein KIS76_00890 [Pyrinomonadaceae bacterium]|nr:hypothetical protein [Pyrinomonadaceae bacterium]
MAISAQELIGENFSYTSSIAQDVWRPRIESSGFDRWYFDALSEDGRDSVVILFLDNFVFSPRSTAGSEIDPIPGSAATIPAIAFFYYRDGKPVYRAINEYTPEEFSASSDEPGCQIGNSKFSFQSVPYGSGYFVSINTRLARNRKLEAHFEWLSIESDFLPPLSDETIADHNWNLAAPRSDVTGRITVSDDKARALDTIHFRGTGYHDHNTENRWLPDAMSEWQWGRAHFSDATAVFYRYKEVGVSEPVSKLFTVRNGELRERDGKYYETNFKRNKFGLRFPTRQTFLTNDNIRLRIKNQTVIDANFFHLRFLSEMTLTLRDGKPRKTIGICEYLSPKALRYRFLDWFVNLRIGRDGKGALLS